MSTLLTTYDDNNPIPAMRLKPGGAQSIAATASSARNATGFDTATRVVSVYATGAVYLRFGNASVTAANTDHYFPAGLYYDFSVRGGDTKGAQHTHLAVLAAGSNCTVYISEKE